MARTRTITIHERTVYARRAAAIDEEAARRYEQLASLSEESDYREEMLTRAEESRASSRMWMESVTCKP